MNKEQIEKRFKENLKENGQRFTSERLLILNSILDIKVHIDADDLFVKLKSRGNKVSRATVYNTLDLLTNLNILSKSTFGESHNHYELNSEVPHHHFICSKCKNVIEFENSQIEVIVKSICKKNKFIPVNYIFEIRGKCKKCSKVK